MEVNGLENTGRKPLHIAIFITMALAMLLRFAVMLYPYTNIWQSHLFGLVPVMLAAPVLGMPQVRRQTGMKLCAIFSLWVVISCLCAEYVPSDLCTVLTPLFLTMAFLFCVCYPMAFALPESEMRRTFHMTASLFVFGMTAISAVAVYAAIFEIVIPSPGGPDYMTAQILDYRLSMFCSSVATGSYAGMALFLSLLLLLDKPHPVLRVLYILCIPVTYFAMALSDARIPSVCISVCIGGLIWLVALKRLSAKPKLVRMSAAYALAGVVILALVLGTGPSIKAANAASEALRAEQTAEAFPMAEQTAEALPIAEQDKPEQAEAAQPDPNGTLSKRPLLYRIGTLNGRTDVWLSAIELFRHEPIKLLTGTSPVFIIRDTQPYLSPDALNEVYPHMHSLLFQTVTALGVPGLLLYAALILYICWHAARVFFLGEGSCSLFERGVALIPLFYAVMDFMDISIWLAPPSSFTSLWFYFAGGYAVYLSVTRIPAKRRKAEICMVNEKEAHA